MKNFEQIADNNKYGLVERADLIKLLEIGSEIEPKVIVEIGVRQGFTFRALVEAFEPDIAIGIDILKKNEIPASDMIPSLPNCYYLWGQNSNDTHTVDKVEELLTGRQIDFLFIDGDHSLGGVTRDFDLYSSLVRPGGIVALHDILFTKTSAEGEAIEVKYLYEELQKKYKSVTINETPKSEEKLAFSSGIGVLFL